MVVNILKNDEQDPTLEEIEKAFDIETVTKEYFLEYRRLFLYTKDELDRVIRERNPQTNLLLGEFVLCIDGKYRYFRPIRVEIYRELGKIIRRRGNGIKTLLCMETRKVWNEVADAL